MAMKRDFCVLLNVVAQTGASCWLRMDSHFIATLALPCPRSRRCGKIVLSFSACPMTLSPSRAGWRLALLLAAPPCALAPAARAQMTPPAPVPAKLPDAPAPAQAAFLINEAFALAQSNPSARPVAVKTAAALLARLPVEDGPTGRDELTSTWFKLAQSSAVSREVRADAYAAFFDVAAKADPTYALGYAGQVKDDAARAGALVDVSRGVEAKDWALADQYAGAASFAAKLEADPVRRARALVFVADRITEFSPARAEGALKDATIEVARLPAGKTRDALYADLIPALARYDVNNARAIAARIADTNLKNLAGARINIAEASLSTVTTRTKDRVQVLATAAAPYDNRALPILQQLPPEEPVLKAISETLPPVYVSARPAIEISQLENLWNYSQKAPAGVYRDQLQSRLARLMVTQDLWRGRAWGQQLTWKGGRVQVGAFLKDVLQYRSSNLQAAVLQDSATKDVNVALTQARGLAPAARVEALLLLAGQLLG